MLQMALTKLTELLGGRVRWASGDARAETLVSLPRIITQAHLVQPGDVYWHVENSTAEADQCAQAIAQGATGIVSATHLEPPSAGWSLQVAQPAEALWELADWNRRRFRGDLVLVSSAAGTDTAVAVMRRALDLPRNEVQETPLSLLTLSGDAPRHVVAAPLFQENYGRHVRACAPTVAVVTSFAGDSNADEAATACRQLLRTLPRDGWAILNGDDPSLRRMAGMCRAKVLWIGRGSDCDFQPMNVRRTAAGWKFSVAGHECHIATWGRQHVLSALAGLAVARVFDIPWSEVTARWEQESFAPTATQPLPCGALVITEHGCGTRAAWKAGMRLADEAPFAGRRVAIIDADHMDGVEAVSASIAQSGIDLCVACGDQAERWLSLAQAAGLPKTRGLSCRHEELAAVCATELHADDVVVAQSRLGTWLAKHQQPRLAGLGRRAA